MKLITALIICLLPFASCTKEDDTLKGPGEGYWILGTKQYNITTTERANNSGYFVLSGKESASSGNVMQVYFQTLPSSGGKYKVVHFEDNARLGSNEIGIKVRMPATGIYSSTGIANNETWLPSSDADLTLTDGKMKIEIPKMTTRISTSAGIDTVFLQGVLIEK